MGVRAGVSGGHGTRRNLRGKHEKQRSSEACDAMKKVS